MKNRAVLSQIEFIIMTLVFALSAAICLKVFAFSSENSRAAQIESMAIIKVQNCAEQIKNSRGASIGDSGLCIYYNEDGTTSESETRLVLKACRTDCSSPMLGTASVDFYCDGDVLFSVPVAWQEVAP